MGHGTRETVLGTLGQVTILQVPHKFQEMTKDSGQAYWKRDTEDPQSKQVLVKYFPNNCTNFVKDQMHFHKSDFSLEILNTSRQDQQLYEYGVSQGSKEKVWQVQLKVFEPVSEPRVQILSRTVANGTCTITLNCTAERGDDICYSTSGLCSHNSSFLHLSYALENTSISCVCTASNLELLVLLVVAVVVIVVVVLVGAFKITSLARHKANQEPLPAAMDNTVHTIYSQVQRVEKPKEAPSATPMSCTTIYSAASSLPTAPGTAPRPPPAAPTLQGHPPLSQSPPKEPMTVYASVTMPTA
ncbi:PREDICTED: signaling lymphocytic activation molecule, partial [Acanthisitta chloris]|uniref:signaling lymphocytic activation molecule n=1 Tax=Acanthisitta chloris TaxID=57068 RepID=UPI0004F0F976